MRDVACSVEGREVRVLGSVGQRTVVITVVYDLVTEKEGACDRAEAVTKVAWWAAWLGLARIILLTMILAVVSRAGQSSYDSVHKGKGESGGKVSHGARTRDCSGLKATVCPDAGVCIDESPESPRKIDHYHC